MINSKFGATLPGLNKSEFGRTEMSLTRIHEMAARGPQLPKLLDCPLQCSAKYVSFLINVHHRVARITRTLRAMHMAS